MTRFLLEAQSAIGLEGEVNVLLGSNRTLHRLNLDFRKKDKPTDVLSFPAPDVAQEQWIGDLAISLQIAGENAASFGHPLEMELKVLLLHGLLHLAGYDHETDNGTMARKERALQKQLGLQAALIERTTRSHHSAASSAKSSRRTPARTKSRPAAQLAAAAR